MTDEHARELEALNKRMAELEQGMDVVWQRLNRLAPYVAMAAGIAAINKGPMTYMEELLRKGAPHAPLGPVVLAMLNGEDMPDVPRELADMNRMMAKFIKTITAAANAERRLLKDPKQHAKQSARKLFDEWQAGGTKYKSGAAFARHVTEQFPEIENPVTVERWVRDWREKARNRAAKKQWVGSVARRGRASS